MPPDLAKLSNEDLLALKAGDMSRVSTDGLRLLKAQQSQQTPADEPFSLADTAKKAISMAADVPIGGPLVRQGLEKVNQAIEHAAYEGGGKVTDVTGSPGLGYAANVGIQAVPALLGAKVGPATLTGPMVSGAKSLMQSAVKPSLPALEKGEGLRAVQTMLEEGINPTAGGVEKLRGKASALSDEIKSIIGSSTATVNKFDVGKRLADLMARERLNPFGDMQAIRDVGTQFINSPAIRGAAGIPVQLAQAMKQAIYKGLEGKYGELGATNIEAQKAVARGLKEEIATAHPEVSPLNEKLGDMINAIVIANRRALMEGNKNPAGLSLLADAKGAALGFLADRSAVAKSMLARMMYSGQRTIPTVGGASAGAIAGEKTNIPED